MSFTPNYLSQRDSRWIDENLGFDDTVTIGTDGCALTCLAMLVNGYGFHETPSSMNRKLKEMGSGIGFLGSLIVWPGLTRVFPKITFRRIIVCRDQPAPVDEIDSSLNSGQPLMIEISQSPSPGLQNHWVILYARQGDDYLMLDPWSLPPDNAPTTLINRYGYGLPPSEFITAINWFDVDDNSSPAPEPAPAADLFAGGPAQTPIMAPAPVLASTPPATPAPNQASTTELTAPPTPASTPTNVPESILPSTFAPTPPPANTASAGGLTVRVSQNIGPIGLRLRDQPATNSNTLVILSAGTELISLEPAEQAIPKIGQVNQWLNVRDGSGNGGYVAAGYVELENTPVTAQAPPSLTVLVSSQASAGLRLRDRPSGNGNTLEVLKPGTLLTVLEPAITAQAKIGVVNQWLHVKLPGGMTGYVAAWYVTT